MRLRAPTEVRRGAGRLVAAMLVPGRFLHARNWA